MAVKLLLSWQIFKAFDSMSLVAAASGAVDARRALVRHVDQRILTSHFRGWWGSEDKWERMTGGEQLAIPDND